MNMKQKRKYNRSPILSTLEKRFSSLGDKVGLLNEKMSLNYKHIDRASFYYACELADNGIKKGQLCGLIIDSQLEFFIVMLALWRIGAVPVIINSDLSKEKLHTVLTDANLSLLLMTDQKKDGFNHINSLMITPIERMVNEKYDCPDIEVSEHDLAAILYTSGSTGIPKGVMLSHRVLGRNFLAAGQQLKLSENDRWLFNIPFRFTSAICHFWTGLMAGATVIALDRMFFPAQFSGIIEDFHATGVGVSPIQVRWLVKSIERPGERLQELKKVMASGDTLHKQTWQLFIKKFPHVELHHVYGMTELGGRFCFLDPSRAFDKIGSVGKPIQGAVCTVRSTSTGKELPFGKIGEVYASGDLLMDGYYRLPEETAGTLTEYGIKTGDLGFMDEEGYLFLQGRVDDMFKSSGEKVSTVLIEQTIMNLDIFHDVTVLAVPDKYLGMVPMVFFVPKENKGFNRSKVIGKLRAILPPSHVPHRFLELSSLPRVGSGKIAKHKLIDMVVR